MRGLLTVTTIILPLFAEQAKHILWYTLAEELTEIILVKVHARITPKTYRPGCLSGLSGFRSPELTYYVVACITRRARSILPGQHLSLPGPGSGHRGLSLAVSSDSQQVRGIVVSAEFAASPPWHPGFLEGA